MKILKILFVISSIFACFSWPSMQSDTEMYIVQVESPESQISTQSSRMDLESWYKSFMPKTIANDSDEKAQLIYSYRNVIIGFAARLTAKQVKEMEKKLGFIAAWPQRILSLHTTHSPSFLGLQQNVGLWRDANYGKGVIIGVLDTGITPDHPSFSDEGMPLPPAKWKGKCESNFTTMCNNKLIGVRNFPISSDSPRDHMGHGTHTSSTAAGSFVKGANVYGNAKGTAAGIAPLAHLAIYKVCEPDNCAESDILAAMDTAIDDGVDILSISLGGLYETFYSNSIALGAYSAAKRGILVSCSAGNGGPSDRTLSNEAPWILTVGASTIDRKLKATVTLGNKKAYEGESAFHPKGHNSTFFPLFYPSQNATDFNSRYCQPGTLNDPEIKGKIVVCLTDDGYPFIEKGKTVKDAGGVGMILVSIPQFGSTTFADAHVLPALYITYTDGMEILDYVNSTLKPIARISFQGTIIGDKNAPVLTAFSSRGPSIASPGILKPDIIGPGLNILAAWPTSVDYNKHTKSTFNILYGTSMSCPHLSGVAALLKSTHPTWSPAAIKSAIMTTANTVNLAHNPILDERLLPASIFAIGAGHVNPSRANDPGLIYDTKIKDYLPYLCGLNYTNQQVGSIVHHKVDCNKVKHIPEAQLNYPSFSITLGEISQTYTRTVTNVGEAKSSYNVEIASPHGVSVIVKPSTLHFSKLNQKLKYQVTFARRDNSTDCGIAQGFLKWSNKKYSVRSAIAVILQPTIGS